MVSSATIPFKKVAIQERDLKVPLENVSKTKTLDLAHYYTGGIPLLSTGVNVPMNYRLFKYKTPGYGVPGALWAAYNYHADVILSPDDVWLSIVHAFSQHVNKNAEKLRSYFVEHKDKKELMVFMDSPPSTPVEWNYAINQFQAEIDKSVKADTGKLLKCDFTTTGTIEKMISTIGCMTSFQEYFEFTITTLCGIRNVYFAGTLADWEKVLTKLNDLGKFEFEYYVKGMSQIVSEFINTYSGKVNLAFWNQLCHVDGLGGSGAKPYFTGWITKFFPYDKDGDKIVDRIDIQAIPEFMFVVPFKLDGMPHICSAGFTGMLYENEAFRPQLSYAILTNEDFEKYLVAARKK